MPIGDLRTDAKENLVTAIQLAAMRQEATALIQEVAFTLNISCIVAIAPPKSTRSISRHSPHSIMRHWPKVVYI